jgi:hypothetical protein
MNNSKRLGWPGRHRSTSWFGFVLLCTIVGLFGCKPTNIEINDPMAELGARELACKNALKDKDRVPIKGGGGYIVISRFAYVPSITKKLAKLLHINFKLIYTS